MQREVEVAPEEVEGLKKRLRHGRKQKGTGRYRKKPGPAPRGLLKAGERARGRWDFRKVSGLLPLTRPGVLMAACYRDSLEDEVKTLFAGTRPGFYTWNVANSAVRHEMRAMMMQEILAEQFEELTLEQKLLLVKHLCDASDKRDEALKKIGLDRLSEMPEDIDPWMVAPEPPEQLPADALAPPDDSVEEMEHTEPLTAAEIVEEGIGDGKSEADGSGSDAGGVDGA